MEKTDTSNNNDKVVGNKIELFASGFTRIKSNKKLKTLTNFLAGFLKFKSLKPHYS